VSVSTAPKTASNAALAPVATASWDGALGSWWQLPTLTADEAVALTETGVLLDARAAERYRGEVEPVDSRAGHIPGARSAPTAHNLKDDSFLPTGELREEYGDLAGSAVGVYCGSGVTAAHEIAALAIAESRPRCIRVRGRPGRQTPPAGGHP
jgi:thiosulfate/3-mercaptopyruvate sulfurtransferase